MNFYIRQGGTDPLLKLKVVDDGRNDRTSIIDLLESSRISFSMYDLKTNKPIILNDRAYVATRKERVNQELKEYAIAYRFTEENTDTPGRYEGIFIIEFLDVDLNVTTKLIVPIKEKLFINII